MAFALRPRARLCILVAALSAVAFLAVFPAQATLAQRRQRAELAGTLAELQAQRKVLDRQVSALQSDEEIERLARLDHHLVMPGEEAYAIVPLPVPGSSEPIPHTRPGDDDGA